MPIFEQPPVKMQIVPAWQLGLRKGRVAVMAEDTKSKAVMGVVIDRRGKVICEIRSNITSEGCVHVEVCGRSDLRCK